MHEGRLRFESDGTPVEGALRTFRLAMTGGFLFAMFVGPPMFLILQRWSAPALITDVQGASWEALESVELDCSAGFAADLP